jgi:hypothetical protein
VKKSGDKKHQNCAVLMLLLLTEDQLWILFLRYSSLHLVYAFVL